MADSAGAASAAWRSPSRRRSRTCRRSRAGSSDSCSTDARTRWKKNDEIASIAYFRTIRVILFTSENITPDVDNLAPERLRHLVARVYIGHFSTGPFLTFGK